MGLGIVLLGPVVFCPPITAVLDGQSRSFQGFDQLPPDGVGDGGSLQAEGAGLAVGESVFGGGSAAFILIAGLAGEREVWDAVAAVSDAGDDVVDGEGAVVPSAVGTAAVPFLEEVLPHFVTLQRPRLIFDPGDLCVRHQLGVELDGFDNQVCYWRPPDKSLGPGGTTEHPVFDRGRQPSFGSGAVLEPRRAVAGFALAAPTPLSFSLQQCVLNVRAVGQFGRPDDFPARFGLEGEGEAGGFGAGDGFEL